MRLVEVTEDERRVGEPHAPAALQVMDRSLEPSHSRELLRAQTDVTLEGSAEVLAAPPDFASESRNGRRGRSEQG